jgi:glutamate-1-semialdehyde aminotransferase
MALIGKEGGHRVGVQGGTYCAHSASMIAAKAYMSYLIENEDEIYPRLAELGEKMRGAMTRAFNDEGIPVAITGWSEDLPTGSSLGMVNFPYEDGVVLDTPEKVYDPKICDGELRSHVLGLALLLEDVHLVHGHGAAASTHTDDDMGVLEEACRNAARRIKPYL